jgi:hypothetical protein
MFLNQSIFRLKSKSKEVKVELIHDIANPLCTDPIEDPDINNQIKELLLRMNKLNKAEVAEEVKDISRKIQAKTMDIQMRMKIFESKI